MRKRKQPAAPQATGPVPDQSKEDALNIERVAKALPKENDERYFRVIEAWRAILGLPKDFAIDPFQITCCMATAQCLVWEKTE